MSGEEERGGRVSKMHLAVISWDFHYSMIFFINIYENDIGNVPLYHM